MRRYPAYFTRDAVIEDARSDVHRRALLQSAVERYRYRTIPIRRERTVRASRPSHEQNAWYVAKHSRQMIEGAASSGTVDAHGTILTPSGMQCAELPIPLYWRHETDKQVGEVVWLRRTQHVIFARAIVDEKQRFIWAAIKDGSLNSFSVGFDHLADLRTVEGVRVQDHWRLKEISLAESGANPEALFSVFMHPAYRPVSLRP